MNDDHNDNDKKMSNAKVALLIAVIPVALFVASFFIKMG